MNIGVSLPPVLLCGQAVSEAQKTLLNAFSGVDGWLEQVRRAGAEYIELRSVKRHTGRDAVRGAAQRAKMHGFRLTVHGELSDEAPEAFWERFEPVLNGQETLVITVHSVCDRATTLELLRRMGGYGNRHFPGARLALENNRSVKGDNIDLVECGGVLETVRESGLSNAGVCWDFGHLYWDHLNHPARIADSMPPDEYIRRTIHTHIHSVVGGRTHFPLTQGVLPLDEYVRALKNAGYQGVYNFEPEMERWAEDTDIPGEFLRSIHILKQAAEG